MQHEIRSCEISCEVKENSGDLVLIGYPIIFEQLTRIKSPSGDYFEIIDKNALSECILSGIPLIYNHNADSLPLAKSPDTMSLTITEKGLLMTATLANTQTGREIYEAVRRRDLSGMSFAFNVAQGGDSFDAASNTRTIKQISKIYECSIVVFPAYTGTTVEARSMIDTARSRYNALRQAKIFINQLKKENI